MEHFVTVCDSAFLPQCHALHGSLRRHLPEATLWVVCVDDAMYSALAQLALENVRPMLLTKLETPELLAVKPGRTIAEYCWTITPFAPRFVFEADPAVQRVTYVDADLWFMRSPDEAFAELERSGKHVLITEHAYDPRYDQSRTSGRFCVQFVTFTREGGEAVRKRWELQCVTSREFNVEKPHSIEVNQFCRCKGLISAKKSYQT